MTPPPFRPLTGGASGPLLPGRWKPLRTSALREASWITRRRAVYAPRIQKHPCPVCRIVTSEEDMEVNVWILSGSETAGTGVARLTQNVAGPYLPTQKIRVESVLLGSPESRIRPPRTWNLTAAGLCK